MKFYFSSSYDVPAGTEEVHKFFKDTSNMSKCWPAELSLRIVESRGNEYTATFRLLGQKWTARFRITELGPGNQYHETLDFPFGKLSHEIRVESLNGGSRVQERMILETLNPLASRFLGRILRYREAMIKKCLGVEGEAVYRDPLRVSLLAGNMVSVAAIAVAVILLLLPTSPNPLIDLVQRIVPWALLWFFTHDLAHLLVGAAVGVRFSYYYIGLSNIVRLGIIPRPLKLLPLALGIKINRAESSASPKGFAAMYAAGPLASMISPLAAALLTHFLHGPSLTSYILLAASILNIAFTAYFSPKAGCLGKARNALKKARET
ncbi:MAG: SRPBCC family protein [Nitrososphaerota archaeon]|nr:SRPBCC family protein [Candidatus Calditenuaceae archaeon]MDW8073721.1 SRPBCC family protein [Nitrososphaerota archaeon]